MEIVEGKDFIKERIMLAGKEFRNCSFLECSLVFDGAPNKLIGCKFLASGFSLEGAAIHTLHFLRDMWENGGWNVVEQFGVDYVGRPLRFGDA